MRAYRIAFPLLLLLSGVFASSAKADGYHHGHGPIGVGGVVDGVLEAVVGEPGYHDESDVVVLAPARPYHDYQSWIAPRVPQGGALYNRPCSVSDGVLSYGAPCPAVAAALNAGAPPYGFAVGRHRHWRHAHYDAQPWGYAQGIEARY